MEDQHFNAMLNKIPVPVLPDLKGFVLYGTENSRRCAFAIVSENGERHAFGHKFNNIIKNFAVEIEDRRFRHHSGIDYMGIVRAIQKNLVSCQILQGGSTITQQLARNLLRDNRRCLARKIKETRLAVSLEKLYSKDELLSMYLENVFFGKNLRGVRSAALHFFNKEPDALNTGESLFLITLLRGPNMYLSDNVKLQKRYRALNNLLHTRGCISSNRHRKNELQLPEQETYPIEVVRPNSVHSITESIDFARARVVTSIDLGIQRRCQALVSNSSCHISIVVIEKGKIVGMSSTSGFDHSLSSRTNVGSVLKPFIYCFLRNNGTLDSTKFPALTNSLNWSVREADQYREEISLEEALLRSNNNYFINAAVHAGLDRSLDFISEILGIQRSFLLPSTLLGATQEGISLAHICRVYDSFFSKDSLDPHKSDCLKVLNRIARLKFNLSLNDVFLKTGTTNGSKERIAVVKRRDRTYAMLVSGYTAEDGKEFGFIPMLKKLVFGKSKIKNYTIL